jgi:hypothetical protein
MRLLHVALGRLFAVAIIVLALLLVAFTVYSVVAPLIWHPRMETVAPPGTVRFDPGANPGEFLEWLMMQKRAGASGVLTQEEVEAWLEKMKRDYPHVTRERAGALGDLKQEDKNP